MARENQGLQIALIIFFILTIILGATTYYFCTKYIDAGDEAQANLKMATDNKVAADAILLENSDLKTMMGFKVEDEFDAINEQFETDKEEYAGGYDDVDKAYRPLMLHLYDLLNKRNVELTQTKDTLQKLQDEYDAWKAAETAQKAKHDQARQAAVDDLAAERNKFKDDRARLTGDQANLQKQLDDARNKAATGLAAKETQLKDAQQHMRDLRAINDQQSEELERRDPTTIAVPDGQITRVNRHGGTVWINRGWADSLREQTTFSVYRADITNLAKARKKASIEVTQIRGEHLAEARITQDHISDPDSCPISDPIMPGDKIHTLVWNPGEKMRFALVGLMDMNGDGKSDRDILQRLIEMHGGAVDYKRDEQGQVLFGKMTISTRYMVVDGEYLEVDEGPGDANGAEAQAAEAQAGVHTEVTDKARQLGIDKITLGELLQQMGWKDQTRVVQLGLDANRKDFRPKPVAGVRRVSTGNVSDRFRPRRPPRRQLSGPGGAY